MKPPAPKPVSWLSATNEVRTEQIAASTALPPSRSTCAPASALSGWPAATTPFALDMSRSVCAAHARTRPAGLRRRSDTQCSTQLGSGCQRTPVVDRVRGTSLGVVIDDKVVPRQHEFVRVSRTVYQDPVDGHVCALLWQDRVVTDPKRHR